MGVLHFCHLSMVYLLECSTKRGCCSHFAEELRSLPVHSGKKYEQICAVSVADQW